MTTPLDEPGPRIRCRDCRKLRPCGCDSKEWALDKAAAAIAKRAGEHIPGPTHARPFGGELDRTDRRAPAEVIGAFVAKREDRSGMQAQLEMVQARLAVVRKIAAMAPFELLALQVEETALRMHVEGATFPEISRALGRASHSHGSAILKRLRGEAKAKGATREVMALPCRCGARGCVVVQTMGGGRPRRWNSEKCKNSLRVVAQRKRRARKRGFVNQLRESTTGWARQGSAGSGEARLG